MTRADRWLVLGGKEQREGGRLGRVRGLTSPEFVRSTLPHLTSRWTFPMECRYARPCVWQRQRRGAELQAVAGPRASGGAAGVRGARGGAGDSL